VQFTGSASGGTSPYSYRWSFGNGQTSNAQNPSVTYNETGNYTVTLTVTDGENKSDSASTSIQVYAVSTTPLEVTASASPRSGTAPLTVHFAASATGGTPPYSYRWRYGNGDSSRKKDPTYTYRKGGNFRATLTVTDAHSNQIVKTLIIKVSDLSVLADFSCAPSSINFGATLAGIQTPAQSFHILDNGYGVVNWKATADKGWISCSADSGNGSEEVFVRVDPQGLSPGKHTGKITVSSPNAITSPQHIAITLEVFEQDAVPVGSMDSPEDRSYVSGTIPISGWALDDIEVERVDIKRSADPFDIPEKIGPDGLVQIGEAIFLERSRSDIPDTYPDYPLTNRGGWSYLLHTYQLPNKGVGSFTFYAIATDTSGQSANIGARTIYCDNSSGSLPFGAIESPSKGENIPGSSYTSTGWALTPPPSSIPEDGSTLWMWIDGMRSGHPVYNQYREDIASLFPEYFNSHGAGISYDFDTNPYPEGEHTLFLSATDNAGSTKFIDAANFTITNGKTDGSQLEYTEAKAFYLEDTEGALNMGIQELKKDYTLETDGNITKDEDGTLVIHTEEMIPLHILFETNKENVEKYFGWGEEEWAKLPVGSTLIQEEGRFCWIPAPGFLGDFILHFAYTDGATISEPLRIKVIIRMTDYDMEKKKQRKIKR
jgi:PKD repeat protein